MPIPIPVPDPVPCAGPGPEQYDSTLTARHIRWDPVTHDRFPPPRHHTIHRALAAAVLCLTLCSDSASETGEPSTLVPRLRRPIALALSADGGTVLVANRVGSVSIVDVESRRCVAEVNVGGQLADICRVPGSDRFLAVDEIGKALIVLELQDGRVEVTRRLAARGTPVGVRALDDGSTAVVASLWGRRVLFFRIDGDATSPESVVDLPFAPRGLLVAADEGVLIVTDSFGGELGIIDIERRALVRVRRLEGHAVRGLALDGGRVLLAHQLLENRVPDAVPAGEAAARVSNLIGVTPLRTLLEGEGDVELARTIDLDAGDIGGADPAGLCVTASGAIVVSLGGVGAVAIGDSRAEAFRRVEVGARPTAVIAAAEGSTAWVASTFADEVTLIDAQAHRALATVPLGPPSPEPTIADRGEVLFHDGRLSGDGRMSCHSCHVDGHTNNRLADTLGDDTTGTPKRVISLLGVTDSGPWAWNGDMPYLDLQVRLTVKMTMSGKALTDTQVNAITAYLRWLTPPPSLALARGEAAPTDAVARGRETFRERRCVRCHKPPEYTSPARFDVGLADEAGRTRFNPPSLRSVSQRDSFFHDGRAGSLLEVLDRFGHPDDSEYSRAELADLIAFLESLHR